MTHFSAAWQIAVAQAAQIAIIAAAVLLASRLLSRRRPHLAHLLWIAVLIKCVTPPLIASPIGIFGGKWLLVGAPLPDEPSQDNMPHLSPNDAITVVAEPRDPANGLTKAEAILASTLAEINPAASRHESNPSVISSELSNWPWSNVLAWAWIGGTLMFGCLGLAKWRVCWKRIRRGELPADPGLLLQMESLIARIGLRRRVRLLVTEARVGPAVVGLWRPTLVIPQQIASRMSAAELEPLLVHELMHVRRGDLWVALLQVLSRAIWWFHPLVWHANRAVTRLSEQCCDVDALAALGYPPARYARSLLQVLELKRELQPVPAFPGVRPLEITTQRLERIMRSRQGSRRARWLDWLLVAVVLAVALPGARLAGTMASEAPGTPASPKSVAEFMSHSPGRPQADTKVVAKTYEVGDLLQTMEQRFSLSRADAQACLKSQLIGNEAGDAKPLASWDDGKLVVTQAEAQHRRTVAELERLRKFGFDSIQLEVRWIKGTPDEIKQASNHWVALPQAAPESNPDDNAEAQLFGEAAQPASSYAIERRPPFMLEILDAQRERTILQKFQGMQRENVLFAPKVRVYNGQSANVMDVSQTPFVVSVIPHTNPVTGVTAHEPQIRVCTEGSQVRLRPVLKGDVVTLSYDLVFSKIGEVEHAEVFGGPSSEKVTVQVPEVTTARIASQADVPLGKTLLVGGLKLKNSEGEFESQLILVKVSKVADKHARKPLHSSDQVSAVARAAATARLIRLSSNIYPKTYPVADLLWPIPEEADLSARAPSPLPGPDFDSLVHRITSMIRPASWGKEPGQGTIQPFPMNLSLVISQRDEVHEEIVRFLAELRQPMREQVNFAIQEILTLAQFDDDMRALLPDEKGTRLLSGDDARRLAAATVLQYGSRITLVNGKGMIFPLTKVTNSDLGIPLAPTDDPAAVAKIRIRSVISKDGKSVELTISRVVDNPQVAFRVDVPDGDLLVVDVSQLEQARLQHGKVDDSSSPSPPTAAVVSSPKTPRYVMLSPRILTASETEEPTLR